MHCICIWFGYQNALTSIHFGPRKHLSLDDTSYLTCFGFDLRLNKSVVQTQPPPLSAFPPSRLACCAKFGRKFESESALSCIDPHPRFAFKL